MATLTPHNPLSLSSLHNAFSPLFHLPKLPLTGPTKTTIIRMGGGPRTYPGGVSKWQWKRMQAKKAKQLLKARLSRERQIYEMRKRAELKAAVAQLERPWEVIEENTSSSRSALFSVSADEQLKVLADRFQKDGGFDLWSQNDGPQLFYRTPHDGLPSSRFFPKGVVHSVKPYGVGGVDGVDDGDEDFGVDDEEMELGFGNLRQKGRNFRGRGEEKVGYGEFGVGDDGEEEGKEYGLGSVRHRRKGEGLGYVESSKVNSRGRGYGKMGSRGFVGGRNEGLDGVVERAGSEVHDARGGRKSRTSGSRLEGGGESRNLAQKGRDGGRSLSRRAGNGSVVGGGSVEGFYGDEEREGNGLHNVRGGRNGRNQTGRGGRFSNLEERDSRRSSSGRLGNDGGSYVGGDSMKSRKKGIEEQNSNHKVMDSDGRGNAHHRNRMNVGSGRRLSIRGRSLGKSRSSNREDTFDMSLQHDGSYGVSVNDGET